MTTPHASTRSQFEAATEPQRQGYSVPPAAAAVRFCNASAAVKVNNRKLLFAVIHTPKKAKFYFP